MSGIEEGVNTVISLTHTADALQKHGEILQWLSSVDYSP
jgi:hypothetical protein